MNTSSDCFPAPSRYSPYCVFLIVLNLGLFAITFYGVIHHDYGPDSPSVMLQKTAETLNGQHISPSMEEPLRQAGIWAMVINDAGKVISSASLPHEIPDQFSLGEVAVFSRGYLHDYPVFVRRLTQFDGTGPSEGLPPSSSPAIIILHADRLAAGLPACPRTLVLIWVFFRLRRVYVVSKIKGAASGRPVDLRLKYISAKSARNAHLRRELRVAASINQASELIHRQNEARANWIRGVTHDLRTPLSMILGYADRIAHDPQASPAIQDQARIIQKQSVKIKDLIQDLTLVSQLEYEMQPLRKKEIHLARFTGTIAHHALNASLADVYSLDLDISRRKIFSWLAIRG